MTELEKIVYEAVQEAVAETIRTKVEAETSAVVKKLLDEHRIEYSSLMHKALITALENLDKRSQ